MKTIIFILSIVSTIFIRQNFDEKELIGTWKANKAFDETNKPCDKNSPLVKDFKLKFLSVDNYEMVTNYGTIVKTNGKYSIDKKNNVLKLTFRIGKENYTSRIPIISQTKDNLIIKYNLCAIYDTINSVNGRLELKKTQ